MNGKIRIHPEKLDQWQVGVIEIPTEWADRVRNLFKYKSGEPHHGVAFSWWSICQQGRI
jgi:hypothetical protein